MLGKDKAVELIDKIIEDHVFNLEDLAKVMEDCANV